MTSRARAIYKPTVVFALLSCLATILFVEQSASAHANLLKASPEPSQALDAPPERVIIWFTEPIEPAFSSIAVLDARGADVTEGDTKFDATEPTAMWVPLAQVEYGTFTVVWQNVSSVDGHKATGSFLFSVGEPLGTGAQTDVAEQPIIQSPADPAIRWIIYIGIAVFAGGLLFELLIATRVARAEDEYQSLSFALAVSNRFSSIALTAIIVVMVAQIAQIALQSAIAFDDAAAAMDPTRVFDVLTQSDWGRFWSWRFTAAVLAALTLFAATQTRKTTARSLKDDELEELPFTTESPFGIAALAIGGIYLLLISLTSHSAATPTDIRWFAVATDLIHVIAATTWVGGISYLLVASAISIRSDDQPARTALILYATRFAPLAIFATTILVASGIVSSLMQVTIPEALNTPYGRVLGAKIVLLVILIALAASNNRSVAKSTRSGITPTRTLRRYITLELAVAFAVLLATAGLASLEPARLYAERKGIGVADYVNVKETVVGATIDAKLDPGDTGNNTLTVNITDDGEPFLSAIDVRARIKYLDDDFGEYFVPLTSEAPGQWLLDDITIGVAGAYQLDVTVVRSDSFDSHVSTRFSAKSGSLASDFIRPSAKTVMVAFGTLIAITGLAYLVANVIGDRPAPLKIHPHFGISILVMAIGIAAILNAFTTGIGIPHESKGNPFPLSQESVQIGLATYTTTCATCHGDTGLGDGPAGLALNPPPADLAVHVPLHTDNELYGFIADGIEGTPMVAQLGNLTSDEIWHLVNYIRTIAD
ncbi:MAG: c-type cytochrome [Chloroflexi bacterium]|nr:c-type cytochrome [Chloroflexota bacterium]MYK60383.1 c-type cytochrome [Chloroflexota bacterium]